MTNRVRTRGASSSQKETHCSTTRYDDSRLLSETLGSGEVAVDIVSESVPLSRSVELEAGRDLLTVISSLSTLNGRPRLKPQRLQTQIMQ
jgi:hypothetical protein